MTVSRILVPVDFSYTSLQALDYAADLGKSLGAEIILLFVVEPIHYATPGDLYAPAANLAMLVEEQERAAGEQLERLARDLEKRGLQARTLLESGNAHQVIVDTAKESDVDLIVIATHGRTGLSHALLGSVAEKVVRSASCPVVTVRRHKRSARKGQRRAKSTPRS